MRHVWIALLGLALPAQVVQVANHSAAAFSGWKRTTIDKLPPSQAGVVEIPSPDGTKAGAVTYVVGRRLGLDLHAVDLKVTLQPGEKIKVDLATAEPLKIYPAPIPDDPIGYFGGIAKCGNYPLLIDSLLVDGAGYTAHLRGRTGRLLNIDLWVTWYPDSPAIAEAEALVTASNSTVPDITETLESPLTLAFGDSLVLVDGAPAGQLMAAGTSIGDGQARVLPLLFVWTRHLNMATQWSNVGVLAERGIGAVGISKLLPEGNPHLPIGFDAAAWTQGKWHESIRRLHTWEPSVPGMGIAKVSGQSGAQADQWFVGGESMNAPGSEWIQYWNAAKWAARPCHHLMPDGRPVDGTGLPQKLVYWDSRPHWNRSVSPERLGKPVDASPGTSNGWWGGDVEHWLIGGLIAGYRYTGSPALQKLIVAQAQIYRLQSTIEPNSYNSEAFVSRAQGYECRNAVLLWHNLEDRDLAERTKQHWLARYQVALEPAYRAQLDRWSPRFFITIQWDDPRQGPGPWWITWQQGVQAHGLALAAETWDVQSARRYASLSAKQILDDAWVRVGDRWATQAQKPVDGMSTVNESFNYYGCSLGPSTVLRFDPTNERALSIWKQLKSEAQQTGQASWLNPQL